MINLEAQVTACQYECEHCCTYGSKGDFNMNLNDIEFILANMKECSSEGYFFPLFDVTNHPQFIDILELSNRYGFPRKIISVNGAHTFSHENFEAMKAVGIVDIQLAFHGIGITHDQFVKHYGAYDKLMTLIESAGEEGFNFWFILFLHRRSINEIGQLARKLKNMKGIRSNDIGFSLYHYQGRAIDLADVMITYKEFEKFEYRDQFIVPKHSEREWLDIARTEEWDKPVFQYDRADLSLYVDRHFDVFFRPYNPYYFPKLPDARNGFRLGNLKTESLKVIMNRVDLERPPYIRDLESITASQLAGIVGKSDETLYVFNDVPAYKWPYEYLRVKYKQHYE